MHDWHSLENKTIWITGGAGYLGSAITEELDGVCRKALCIDLGTRAHELVRDKKLKRTQPATLDVNKASTISSDVESLLEQHGVPDGVVHLAYASSAGKRLEELTPEDLEKTFDHSLSPTILFCRTLAERMKPRGSGSIVLFSSMYGVVSPDPRVYRPPMTVNPIDYGVSKAGILQMARYLAVHYGPSGIRFNCVTPGPFPSPQIREKHPRFVEEISAKTAFGRVGRQHEIVGPTLFLLTDSASFVTGHSLMVDGGWTAW